MKNKNYHTVGTFPKFNRKFVKPMTNEHEHEFNIRTSSSGMISQDQFKMQYRINILVDIAESIKTKPNLK
jgi:hypothetical protein